MPLFLRDWSWSGICHFWWPSPFAHAMLVTHGSRSCWFDIYRWTQDDTKKQNHGNVGNGQKSWNHNWILMCSNQSACKSEIVTKQMIHVPQLQDLRILAFYVGRVGVQILKSSKPEDFSTLRVLNQFFELSIFREEKNLPQYAFLIYWNSDTKLFGFLKSGIEFSDLIQW